MTPHRPPKLSRASLMASALALLAWSQAAVAGAPAASLDPRVLPPKTLALINRVTWGVDQADAAAVASMGVGRWLDHQLHPSPGDRLPPQVQDEIAAMPYNGARRIGRLMQGQFNLAFVDVGGWDTHVNQGNATGYLAGRLANWAVASPATPTRSAPTPGTTPWWW
jgi:hypothetical protein